LTLEKLDLGLKVKSRRTQSIIKELDALLKLRMKQQKFSPEKEQEDALRVSAETFTKTENYRSSSDMKIIKDDTAE
jgi:signal-transduction protein with cAMP-binding, CBS, and nucleotidyltransferase domain